MGGKAFAVARTIAAYTNNHRHLYVCARTSRCAACWRYIPKG